MSELVKRKLKGKVENEISSVYRKTFKYLTFASMCLCTFLDI